MQKHCIAGKVWASRKGGMRNRFNEVRWLCFLAIWELHYCVCRYTGYCPQYKYRHSKTYGAQTHDLLAQPDENTARSEQIILRDIHPPAELSDRGIPDMEAFEDSQAQETIRNRQQSHGDQKLLDPIIPGYSGT